MSKFCNSCRYWKGEVHVDSLSFKISFVDGACTRFPPAWPKKWPVTSYNDSCGEHDLMPPSVDEMFAIQKPKDGV